MSQPQADSAYREGTERVIVTTGNDVAGFRVREYLGVVRSIVVRSRKIGQAFLGAFEEILGGNISEYVDVCEAAASRRHSSGRSAALVYAWRSP